ncbi:MAG: hypothetical protein ABIL25_03055 [candidate division WOR-3 bacterium]
MSLRMILGVFLLLVCSVATANLLVNGDFSNWTDPTHPASWTVEDTVRAPVAQSTTYHSAPYSARITRMVSGTGNNFGVNQWTVVSPDQDYTLTAWYLDNDPNARGGIGISWYTQDSTYISATGITYTDSAITTWQRLVKTATAPSTAGLAKVTLRVYGFTNSQPGGIVYVDDAELNLTAAVAEPTHPRVRTALLAAPNPSSGSITFSLDLAGAGPVRLEVYDMAGCLRNIIHAGPVSRSQTIAWAGTDSSGRPLPSGLYFAVATWSEGRTEVQKVVLDR